jgi:carbamoylphosphate synthase large subunit
MAAIGAAMQIASQVAAHEFGLSGLHGIDFIRDREGNTHVLEVNPRATHGGTLAFGAGRDLPSALASAMTGIPMAMRPAIDNDIVALFPRERRRDPSSEFLRIGFHDVPWGDPRMLQAVLKS